MRDIRDLIKLAHKYESYVIPKTQNLWLSGKVDIRAEDIPHYHTWKIVKYSSRNPIVCDWAIQADYTSSYNKTDPDEYDYIEAVPYYVDATAHKPTRKLGTRNEIFRFGRIQAIIPDLDILIEELKELQTIYLGLESLGDDVFNWAKLGYDVGVCCSSRQCRDSEPIRFKQKQILRYNEFGYSLERLSSLLVCKECKTTNPKYKILAAQIFERDPNVQFRVHPARIYGIENQPQGLCKAKFWDHYRGNW